MQTPVRFNCVRLRNPELLPLRGDLFPIHHFNRSPWIAGRSGKLVGEPRTKSIHPFNGILEIHDHNALHSAFVQIGGELAAPTRRS